MAWRAKLAKKTLDQQNGVFALTVDYYDDADPAITIVRRDISVPATASLAEIVLMVRAEGARERAKHNFLADLDAKIAVGADIAV